MSATTTSRREIEPELVANVGTPLACPRCGATAVRERITPGGPGRMRWAVTCTGCDFEQRVERFPSGSCETVPAEPEPKQPRRSRDDVKLKPLRAIPICAVAGCRHRAAEGGFCDDHWASYVAAGRPEDRAAWAESQVVRASEVRASEHQTPHKAADGIGGPEAPEMPARSPFTECRCEGCNKPPSSHGLCATHALRWRKAGKPAVEKFLVDPELSGPIGPRGGHNKKPKPVAQAPPRRGGRPRRSAPSANGAPSPLVATATPGYFTDVALPEPIDRLRVGRLGDFLTLTDAAGRVLHQLPLSTVPGTPATP